MSGQPARLATVPPRALHRRVLSLRDGRLVTLAVVALYLALVIALAAFRDGIEDWSLLGVPPMPDPFADTASITSAWECDRRGIPVVPENPCDPYGRPANYPSLWVEASVLGLGNASTVLLGVAVAVAFFAAAMYLAGPIGVGAGLLWGVLLCSPAVMLGVERGNVDLLLFAVCVLALRLLRGPTRAGRIAAHALLLLAAVLKLYPALTFAVLARRGLRAAAIGLGTVSLAFAVYLVVRRDELQAVAAAVPQFTDLSYGASAAFETWSELEPSLATRGAELVFFALALLGAVAVAALVVARSWGKATVAASGDPFDLDALWVGAAVFVGTFFLVSNWNYRLVFLLFAVPVLLRWQRERSAPLAGARTALIVLVLVLWLSAPVPALPIGPSGVLGIWDVFPWEEVLGWFLASYLIAALVATRCST